MSTRGVRLSPSKFSIRRARVNETKAGAKRRTGMKSRATTARSERRRSQKGSGSGAGVVLASVGTGGVSDEFASVILPRGKSRRAIPDETGRTKKKGKSKAGKHKKKKAREGKRSDKGGRRRSGSQKGASTYRRSSKRAAELDERPTHERAAAIAALSVRDMVLQRHDVVMVRPSSLALAGASGNGPLFGKITDLWRNVEVDNTKRQGRLAIRLFLPATQLAPEARRALPANSVGDRELFATDVIRNVKAHRVVSKVDLVYAPEDGDALDLGNEYYYRWWYNPRTKKVLNPNEKYNGPSFVETFTPTLGVSWHFKAYGRSQVPRVGRKMTDWRRLQRGKKADEAPPIGLDEVLEQSAGENFENLAATHDIPGARSVADREERMTTPAEGEGATAEDIAQTGIKRRHRRNKAMRMRSVPRQGRPVDESYGFTTPVGRGGSLGDSLAAENGSAVDLDDLTTASGSQRAPARRSRRMRMRGSAALEPPSVPDHNNGAGSDSESTGDGGLSDSSEPRRRQRRVKRKLVLDTDAPDDNADAVPSRAAKRQRRRL